MCAKLRRSMVAPDRSPLAGLVEVDETEIACRSKNDPLTGGGRRSHQGKMLVVGAVEVADSRAGPGRIRLAELADYSADSLHPFIADSLAAGATAKTDGWSAYPGAPGVSHDPHVIGKIAAHIVLPWLTQSSPTSRSGLWASITSCAAGISRATLSNSMSASIAPYTAGRVSSFRHRRQPPTHHLPNVDLTGSKGISLVLISPPMRKEGLYNAFLFGCEAAFTFSNSHVGESPHS